MKVMFALAAAAALPAAVTLTAVTRSAPTAVRATVVEGTTARPADRDTFRSRWLDVVDMPPTVVTKVEPILLVHTEQVSRAAAGSPVSPPLRFRRVSMHRDICARHGMRKVHYGRRWRCRR